MEGYIGVRVTIRGKVRVRTIGDRGNIRVRRRYRERYFDGG
jgi:hypothetical protein